MNKQELEEARRSFLHAVEHGYSIELTGPDPLSSETFPEWLHRQRHPQGMTVCYHEGEYIGTMADGKSLPIMTPEE